MTVDECPHGALYPLEPCTPCQGGPARRLPDVGPEFTMRFDGTCPGCGFDLRPGQTGRIADGSAHHTACVDTRSPR